LDRTPVEESVVSKKLKALPVITDERPWLFSVAAVGIGVVTSLQSRVNGLLSVNLSNGVHAAMVSYCVGLVFMLVLVIFLPRLRHGLSLLPGALRNGDLSWWQMSGGAIGGFFVAAQSMAVPVAGVTTFAVAVITGQIASSLFVDKVGLGPAGKQAVTSRRLLAAFVALVAVALTSFHRLTVHGHVSVIVILLAFAAGFLIAFQQAFNAKVGEVSGSVSSATTLNSALGTLVLCTAFGVSVIFFDQRVDIWPLGPVWIYAGGILGLVSIAGAVLVVTRIGVLAFTLLLIAGQLVGALLLDLLVPAEGFVMTWALVLGMLLAFIAVKISSLGTRRSKAEPILG